MVRKLKIKNQEKTIDFNKTMSNLIKGTKVSECLWNEECSKEIINSHSIQNNRFLSKISINGDLYRLGHGVSEDNSLIWNFENIGRKSFSTFKGFCGKHDNELFKSIEIKEYEGSKEQHFLFAFRALAKEYHAKKESINFYEKLLSLFKNTLLEKNINFDKITLDLCSKEFQYLKNEIKNQTFNGFYTLSLELDKEYPIVCNSTFLPYITANFEETFTPLEYEKIQKGELNPSIFLNVFPTLGKTIILISCLELNKKFLDNFLLSFSEKEKIKEKISTMILQYCENTAFSPDYILNKFSKDEKNLIENLYSENIKNTLYTSRQTINLFRD